MRKSILTKALMLVALVVCLVCALGVTAFAENTSKELVSATGDVTITTEYGELVIPAEYADANAYPFVIFDGDNQFLAATPKLNGESASTHAFQYAKENLAAGKTMLIYMRRDYTTGAEYCTQMGAQKKTSTLILDLGGNTLTLGNYLWWSYSLGDDNTYVTQITKNGTINSGNYWMYSGGSYWKNKEYFVRFKMLPSIISKANLLSRL